jgi:formylglycine-generating enzyme required for sulfatase activity
MKTHFINYRIGIQEFLNSLGKQHSQYLNAANYQNQLLENLNDVEQFGDNDTLRSTRNRLISQLDQLAMMTLEKTFSDLSKPKPISLGRRSSSLQEARQWEFEEPEMSLISAGTFIMGSPEGLDQDAFPDEYPLHIVNLPAFYIATTAVTNLQYETFVLHEKYPPPSHWDNGFPSDHNHPVTNISWYDAIAFCNWLAKITDKPYRLPTEAEWEKAARGNYAYIFPWGNQWKEQFANTEEYHLRATTSVNGFPDAKGVNELLNAVGNVYEWTGSLWGRNAPEPQFRYPYNLQDGREALDAPSEILRVVRGGGFSRNKRYARCAHRDKLSPKSSRKDVGLRLALACFNHN